MLPCLATGCRAGHVLLWLQGRTADDMRHELDALARELFTD